MMQGGNGWDSTVNLDSLQRQIAVRAERGAFLAAEHILGESTALVPIEERTLQDSGKTSSESDGDSATAAVSYDTPYAVRQHEEMDWRHDQGRTAKYLERPAQQAASSGTAAAIIATQLRPLFGGSGGSPSPAAKPSGGGKVNYTNAKGVTRQVTQKQANAYTKQKSVHGKTGKALR